MKNTIKLILLSLIISVNAESQTITWQKTYGDPFRVEFGYSIIQLADEGYIAGGEEYYSTGFKMFVMRLDKFGTIIWKKNYNFTSADGISKTNDGNYLIGGTDLLKINLNGDTLWTRPGVKGSNFNFSSDGGFYLCGGKFVSPQILNPNLRKFDSLGILLWEKIYSNNIFDGFFSSLLVNEENDLILIGNYSDSAYITNNPFIMKTDSMGNLFWFYGYNEDSLKNNYINGIIKNNKGEYIAGGSTFTSSYFFNFDTLGILQSIKYFDYHVQPLQFNSLIKTNDNGFAFTGYYRPDSVYYTRLLKTNSNGEEEWRKLFGIGCCSNGYNVRQTSDSGYIIIGNREINGYPDVYIIKTDKNGYANPPVSINSISEEIPNEYILYQNFPNPFNPVTKIKFEIPKSNFVTIKIYDILGKEISTFVNEFKNAGKYESEFDGSDLSSGIYFYSLSINSELISIKKFILLK